jgi:hypothetical protein
MAVPLFPFGDPKKFVSWKFVCKTPAEVKRTTKIANQTLRAFLKGFNEGMVWLGQKKQAFVIKNKVLKQKEKGSNIFLFEPLVFRKPKSGPVTVAGAKVQKPPPPTP